MKDLQLQSLTKYVTGVKNWIIKYRISLFVTAVAVAFGFMTLRIATMSTAEPTSQQKAEALVSIKVVKIDENAIEVINQLQDKNIPVETLFDPGRYDPFND